MAELSRRYLVVSGLAGAGASLLPAAINEANAATSIRYNLASPNGQAMLRKYAEAVKKMMALPPSDPLSWTFQWYTHAVPTNTTKAAAINSIFGPNPSPHKSLATLMWNTCQAHFSAADEPWFLPWHRMYVCFFEDIIRAVLKDPKFTLPYWNYSVPAGYPLPKEFRMQNDPVWGPLFRPNRNPTTNAGQPIYVSLGGSPSDLSPSPAMSQSSYLPNGAVSGFDQTLDLGLHGNVHVFVGNSAAGMGSIPWAAGDPVFWVHHCNIDRIWTSWNAAGHANPTTSAWSNKEFVFADVDGKEVKAVVREYTNTKKCDYSYDQLIGEKGLVAEAIVPSAPATPTTVAKTEGGPLILGAEPVRASLQATAAPAAGVAPLAGRLAALPESHRLYLVIDNFKADAQPDTLYRVYLDLPDGPPSDPVNSNYVGSFNFFAAVPHGGDHDHGDIARSISFDITDIASNLDAKGLLKAQHVVTIVPATPPAGDAKPVVGDISFVEQ
jgi:tyrosinase